MPDRFEVRIGGDASGPVVVGHGNVVETQQADPSPDSTQTNTANDNATVYTVMHGDLHIHQEPEP